MSKQEQNVTGVDSLIDVAKGRCGDRGVIHIGNVMEGFLSHKRVDAAVIIAVGTQYEDGRMDFEIANPVYHELSITYTASADMLVRFTPGVGDYIVLYKDDYVSFSPKDAFEDGYKPYEDDRACSGGDMDADMERDIEALDLTAPRVTPEQIDALMAGVVYHTHVVPGTTTTLATAIAANGFTLAIGMTACADPANFHEEFGAKYAIRDAESKARSQLWKLEGWRLKCELAVLVAGIAKKCHEMNRSYCLSIGDDSQHSWECAPEWQRQSAIGGVLFHIKNPNADPDASHNNWMAEKLAEGWKFGHVKDVEKKEHPCLVPFSALPREQQVKDSLFKAMVDLELGRT